MAPLNGTMAGHTQADAAQKRKKSGLFVLIALLCIAIVLAAVHPLLCIRYRSGLEKRGLYNPVDAQSCRLNLLRCGQENGSHRIIALAGYGVGNISLSMRRMTAPLEKENEVVFLDRAGYGASDNMHEDMTVARIVEDYRIALQNAGVQAPYVLMPHSIAGVYATYWECRYPDEIERVIFLDGTYVTDEQETVPVMMQRVFWLLSNTPLPDFAMLFASPSQFSDPDTRKADNFLTLLTNDSSALVSEMQHESQNMLETYDLLAPNDIPKLYISAEQNLDAAWAKAVMPDFTGSDAERLEAAINEMHKYRDAYLDKLGSCEVRTVESDHFLYQTKPEECAEIIQEFLAATEQES